MTETKTPPNAKPTEGTLSAPFENSSLLDLDDPNITGSLLESLGDDNAELLLSNVVPAYVPAQHNPNELASSEDNESSFSQLWASALTEDEAPMHAQPEPQHTTDHFAAWQEAAERHHLPAAVELLPPIIHETEDEEEASALPPTGFFSTEDAPLFFVNEQWAPGSLPLPQTTSQNPFEESVAVLRELSFQNTPQKALSEEFLATHNPQYSASVSYLSLSPPEITPPLFPLSPEITPGPSLPDMAQFPNSPPVLQTSLWLVDDSENTAAPTMAARPPENSMATLVAFPEEENDIILLEDELPPEADEAHPDDILHFGISPNSAQDFSLFETQTSQSFPPKIPPVVAADTPSLLTPAIFYDDDSSQWPSPPKNIPQLFQGAPLPHASANFQVPGHHRVVLYTMSGAVKRGAFENPDLGQPSVSLKNPEEVEQISVEKIKAVYFMKPTDTSPPSNSPFPPPGGSYWKVVFHDGRRVEGQLSELQGASGFFLIPSQGKSPTAYLYINRSAVREMSSLI
ncbi:MAG: hypothetical protein FWC28_03935 [Proteobacteria bacterium]|nr:hypothetical protein [Pseudomonadota bacterium]